MSHARILLSIVAAGALAGCGTDVSGPSPSIFSCILGTPTSLEVGEALQVRGAGNQALCLSGQGAAAEFIYVPFFGREPPEDEEDVVRLEVELTGAGVRSATVASASPDPTSSRGAEPLLTLAGPAGVPVAPRTRDHAFHDRLLRRQRAELEPRMRGDEDAASSSSGSRSGAGIAARAVPTEGDLLELNVAISCSAAELRTGRVEYVSDRAVVVADLGNPSGGLAAADYAFFGETFDTLIGPTVTGHFGDPTDIDGNQRVIIFFTRAVNERTPPDSETFIGGFFWSGDLFPETDTQRLTACPAANQAEMFYMLTADPNGEVNGNRFTAEFVRSATPSIIAHEYQHLINAGRRLYVNNARSLEEVWLDEGLSHIAEELVFLRAADLEPGSNLGLEAIRAAPEGVAAFNRYMAGNFTNFRRFLQRPDTASLMGIDVLPTRGASWAFLRYAADRSARPDDAFFFDVVNSTTSGVANLDEVTGAALSWMRDWTVAVYADDFVPGVEARFTQPSWNFRALYGDVVGSFPLRVLALQPGETEAISLRPGGTAYPRFSVDAGGRATIHVEADGGEPAAALLGSVLRTR